MSDDDLHDNEESFDALNDPDDRGLRWVGYCEYLVGVAHETTTAGTNAATAPSAQYGRRA